jgi:translation initiation factor IF-2
VTETKEPEKKTLSLNPKGTLSLKGGAPAGGVQIRQSLSQGRSQTVAVEVRRKRTGPKSAEETAAEEVFTAPVAEPEDTSHLTNEEREARMRAIQNAKEDEERRRAEEAHRRVLEAEEAKAQANDAPKRTLSRDELRAREFAELQIIQEEERKKADAERAKLDAEKRKESGNTAGFHKPTPGVRFHDEDAAEEESYRSRLKRGGGLKTPSRRDDDDTGPAFKSGRLTVNQVINEVYDRDKGRSAAAMKRARQKARAASGPMEPAKKIIREVVLPETISVQELANRMAERSGDVVKSLMKMGVMATINQMIDADTAELIAAEMGHTVRRVTEADVETELVTPDDTSSNTTPRAPVVTIMGHVDHGKTSLLDALRTTNVVAGEAGGITQHIGAYQVTIPSGQKITFLDTPGHAAFSDMRARGANITDIVVLVVAANDGIMPQTIEAISHAKAANVPIIVAINKIDLPDANVTKVKQDLLQHELVVEDMGGDVLAVEVSAKQKRNLDKLLETILLQAEVLDLKANPDGPARGTVVEAKMEQGRGSVATVLVQNGTLRVGDIFVAGAQWGRVRDIRNDMGENIKSAEPGLPVEITGLNGTPDAGDDFATVPDESKAREVSDYRQRKRREAASLAAAGGKTFEQLLAVAQGGGKKELAVVIKADVHGSVEAIAGSLQKAAGDNEEVAVRVLHTGVGPITESDISLARASNAVVIGFNVRANAQARTLAEQSKINIRYYNIIYNIIDDVKLMLTGMLNPTSREEYLGQAEIRAVFNITKVGKVAGCMVTTGSVKRGSKVRLLRDDVVIHEGTLKTLKRVKDEVKEVAMGTECGMAFENYDDIKEGDVIECFDVVSEKREL